MKKNRDYYYDSNTYNDQQWLMQKLSQAWILPNFICKVYFVFIEIKQVKLR